MFAIAFDLVVRETERLHPKADATFAYGEIRRALESFGFEWQAGEPLRHYERGHGEPLCRVARAEGAPVVPGSVRDIRAFRIEQWSDFTRLVKS